MLIGCVVLFASVFCATCCSSEVEDGEFTYKGFKVFRVVPRSEFQLNVLHRLQKSTNEIDFWTDIRAVNSTVDIMTSPRIGYKLKNIFKKSRFDFSVLIEDVQTLIDKNKQETDCEIANKEPNNASYLTWTDYHRLETIYSYITELHSNNKDFCELYTIGKSHEGRELKVIKIGKAKGNKRKPSIWIDAGIHAREWISPATALYIIDQLVNNYTNNKELVDKVDWYVLPVINPDGYEFSHTNKRLWRKTRSANENSSCIGKDANRNFGFSWNMGGSSGDPCSETYRGEKAFSESETTAIAKFLQRRSAEFKLYLSLHSYGQFLLLPWGHTQSPPDDYSDLENLGKSAISALTSYQGTEYSVGNSNKLLYPTSGSSSDWAKGTCGIKYSYVLELPDKENGFLLPPSKILPVVYETWLAVKVFGEFIGNL